MGIDINDFSRKYGLVSEPIQAGDHRIRLTVANGEPPFEDAQQYNRIAGSPLLCPLDRGGWALVRSNETRMFDADSVADAVDHAKRVLAGNE